MVLLTACINIYTRYSSHAERDHHLKKLNLFDDFKNFEIYLEKFLLSNTYKNITNNLW